MKEINIKGHKYFYIQGLEDAEKRFLILQDSLRSLYLMYRDPTIDQYINACKILNYPFTPPSSMVGKYVMTDMGLMYTAYGRYFTLGATLDSISDIPYCLPVVEIRAATGFDF